MDPLTSKALRLGEALIKAQESASKIGTLYPEDGGTCNLDSVLIKLQGWKLADIEQASFYGEVPISDKLTGIYRGYRFVMFTLYGQANRRTRMVEAAKKSLEASGYDVTIYWQMD